MRRVLPIVLLVLVVASVLTSAQQPARAPAVVIKAARMFDGRSATTTPDAVVIVEGTKITAAGSRLAVPRRQLDRRSRECDAASRIHRRAYAPVGRNHPTTGTRTRSPGSGAPCRSGTARLDNSRSGH